MGDEDTAGETWSVLNGNFTVLAGIPFLFANECAIIHSKGCDKYV